MVESLKSRYSVKLILDIFNIPKSNYYRWKRKNCEIDLAVEEIKSICRKRNYTYGYRKVTAELNKYSEEKIKKYKE